jgi:hypothetical protein
MALTGSFKELMQKRVASDPAFGEALLREGIDTMLAGDADFGRLFQTILHETAVDDYGHQSRCCCHR